MIIKQSTLHTRIVFPSCRMLVIFCVLSREYVYKDYYCEASNYLSRVFNNKKCVHSLIGSVELWKGIIGDVIFLLLFLALKFLLLLQNAFLLIQEAHVNENAVDEGFLIGMCGKDVNMNTLHK